MANIDANIDAFSKWLWTTSITYGLVSWNWVMSNVEKGTSMFQTSLSAVLSAHMNDIWLFRERNSTPWPVKEGWDDGRVSFDINMNWYPAKKEFIILSNETIKRNHAFTNVVTAELVCEDKNLKYDMSSFFHDIRWHSAENDGPSVYEVVLVYCLTNNLPFSSQLLKTFNLEVMTADAENLVVPVMTKEPFLGSWSNLEKSASASTSSSATASPSANAAATATATATATANAAKA